MRMDRQRVGGKQKRSFHDPQRPGDKRGGLAEEPLEFGPQRATERDRLIGLFQGPDRRPPTTTRERLVQQFSDRSSDASREEVYEAATRGVAGTGASLPHHDRIQTAFGPEHDLSSVHAYVGGEAAQASRDMGARAFTLGDQVGFRQAPDLRLAAHEAAHVVQQRQGAHVAGGVGERGDRFERQADAVADKVVRGESAESLLGPGADARTARSSAVQRDDSSEEERHQRTMSEELPHVQIQFSIVKGKISRLETLQEEIRGLQERVEVRRIQNTQEDQARIEELEGKLESKRRAANRLVRQLNKDVRWFGKVFQGRGKDLREQQRDLTQQKNNFFKGRVGWEQKSHQEQQQVMDQSEGYQDLLKQLDDLKGDLRSLVPLDSKPVLERIPQLTDPKKLNPLGITGAPKELQDKIKRTKQRQEQQEGSNDNG
jgi:hypothetical protein